MASAFGITIRPYVALVLCPFAANVGKQTKSRAQQTLDKPKPVRLIPIQARCFRCRDSSAFSFLSSIPPTYAFLDVGRGDYPPPTLFIVTLCAIVKLDCIFFYFSCAASAWISTSPNANSRRGEASNLVVLRSLLGEGEKNCLPYAPRETRRGLKIFGYWPIDGNGDCARTCVDRSTIG